MPALASTHVKSNGIIPYSSAAIDPMPIPTSIAVCTYNGELYLQEQLDSLLAQTQLPGQIVIRDDHSTDGTPSILRAFALTAQARGIAVDLQFNSENLGYRRNFDGALRACTGELVFLCDQDDIWHSCKLERFCAKFDERPELLALHSDAALIDGEGRQLASTLFKSLRVGRKELRRMHRGDALNLMLKCDLITGATLAFRRRVLADALPLPETVWVHDAWIGVMAAMRGDVDSLPELLIRYRLHSNNQLGLGNNDPMPRNARRKCQLEAEVDQTRQLLVRANALGLPNHVLDLIRRRQRHVSIRADLPSSRIRRIPIVLGEFFAGNYERFGRGMLSAGVDLVRP